MGVTMSRQNFCDPEAEARSIVSRAISVFRRAGHKNEDAVSMAADLFRISQRKAWSLKYGQPVRVTPSLRERLLACWWTSMERRAAELRRDADALEEQARTAALANAGQYELQLGVGDVERAQSRILPVAMPSRHETRRLRRGRALDEAVD